MTEQLHTVEQIDAKIAELQKLREDVETKQTLRKQVEELIQGEGFSLEDIFPELRRPAPATTTLTTKPKSKRTPAGEPKYQHPENPSLTWVGKGNRPKWVKEHVENGGKLEDLEIKS